MPIADGHDFVVDPSPTEELVALKRSMPRCEISVETLDLATAWSPDRLQVRKTTKAPHVRGFRKVAGAGFEPATFGL
jgi:hypothetical protein